MKYVLIIAAILTTIPLTLVATSSGVKAKRLQDYPNYGFCPGSNRPVRDVSRCRPPGPNSGPCPPGTFTKFGRSWAYDRRYCRAPSAALSVSHGNSVCTDVSRAAEQGMSARVPDAARR